MRLPKSKTVSIAIWYLEPFWKMRVAKGDFFWGGWVDAVDGFIGCAPGGLVECRKNSHHFFHLGGIFGC